MKIFWLDNNVFTADRFGVQVLYFNLIGFSTVICLYVAFIQASLSGSIILEMPSAQ